jgi:beta-carotene hydroxylase
MTRVFVPQDVAYLGVDAIALDDLNPRLVPLIAHDRAGFGGAVCVLGLIVLACAAFAAPTPGLWRALAAAGVAGFGSAIGVHPAIGYTDPVHLAPAVLGALTLSAGLGLTYRRAFAQPGPSVGVPALAGASANRLKAVLQHQPLPPLRTLGPDLLTVSHWERLWTLGLPFAWAAAYFAFAAGGWWPAAVLALVALSFVTYGSTSHDLVHRSLGLSRRTNDVLLCVIELLALRSGHAYQAAHLNHHARFPHPDDVEAVAARRSFLGALAEGPVFHLRLYLWALRHARQGHTWIVGEGIGCIVLATLSAVLIPVTPAFAVYAGLMVAGSWVIPLVTSYIPHDPHGDTPLTQTRAFRGLVASAVAVGHLYHLEHHLYPAVPHRRWRRLARRLDPDLARAGVRPVRFWF